MDNPIHINFKAAFRHYVTQTIVVCPFTHDYMELPEYRNLSGPELDSAFEAFNGVHRYEEGFVDQDEKFYTRDEAMKITGISGESIHLFEAGFGAEE